MFLVLATPDAFSTPAAFIRLKAQFAMANCKELRSGHPTKFLSGVCVDAIPDFHGSLSWLCAPLALLVSHDGTSPASIITGRIIRPSSVGSNLTVLPQHSTNASPIRDGIVTTYW